MKKNAKGDKRRNTQVRAWLVQRAEARAVVCSGTSITNRLAFWYLKQRCGPCWRFIVAKRLLMCSRLNSSAANMRKFE